MVGEDASEELAALEDDLQLGAELLGGVFRLFGVGFMDYHCEFDDELLEFDVGLAEFDVVVDIEGLLRDVLKVLVKFDIFELIILEDLAVKGSDVVDAFEEPPSNLLPV